MRELLRLEGTPGGHPVQNVYSSMFTESRFPRTMSRQLLKVSKDRESISSLGNLLLCAVIFTVKKYLLILRRNQPYFSLCLFGFALSLGTIDQSLAPLSFNGPFRYPETLMRSHLNLLFSRLRSLSPLHLSFYGRYSSPFIILVQPLTRCSPVDPCLSCSGEPRSGHSMPAVASLVLRRGEGSVS